MDDSGGRWPPQPLSQLLMQNPQVAAYWQSYIASLPVPSNPAEPYVVNQFGDNPALADELGSLVVQGVKTATCSALWEWEAEGSDLPAVGLKTIVLNGNQQPICIIETIEVNLCPFNEVDASFAYAEGEGDRSLESWQAEHWKYFSRVLPQIGKQPAPDMPLVCERFRLIYS